MCDCLCTGLCCCCGACCCAQCCEGVRRKFGKERSTKLCYLFVVAIFTVPSILVFFLINKWNDFETYFSWMDCPDSSGGGLECIGPSVIYRISLAFLALFLLMLLVVLTHCSCAMTINEGGFCLKYLFVLTLFIVFLFIGGDTFNDYSQASKYISILFMAIQSIILVDLFYLAGIKLVAKYDAGQQCYGCLLIFLFIIIETIAIVLNIIGYTQFSSGDGCGNSLWVNILTTIILVVLPILQCLNFNKQNSLLTTSLVSVYISYLAFISQYSYGQNGCTDRVTYGSLAVDIIVSTFFFILTMYGSIVGGSGQVKVTEDGDVVKAMGVAPTGNQPTEEELDADNENKKKQEAKKEQKGQGEWNQDNEEEYVKNYTQGWGWVKWHFYMCLAAMYVGMLVTNWTSASLTTGDLVSTSFDFWVRVIISWFTALVYVWTLIAPKVFPERDFTVT